MIWDALVYWYGLGWVGIGCMVDDDGIDRIDMADVVIAMLMSGIVFPVSFMIAAWTHLMGLVVWRRA